MLEALRRVLGAAPARPEVTSLPAWASRRQELSAGLAVPIDRAIVAGFFAPRVAHAFVAGYHAALESLLGEAVSEPVSLCVTEEGGAHPRAIQTALRPREGGGFTVSGKKRWTTLTSSENGILLVAASTGPGEGGRNGIKLARVRAGAPGVTLTPMPVTPFLPEIPHAEILFEAALVDEVLPGDGYERYVKPFRTVEDLHVHAAVMAHVLGTAKLTGWPAGDVEELAALLVSARGLALCDPGAPEVHVALGGLLGLARAFLSRTEERWALADAGTRDAWLRDRALLKVAEGARVKRLESAHRSLA